MIFDEFVHPYIDNQIEDPAIRERVDFLVNEELKSMDPLIFEKKEIAKPVFIIHNPEEATRKRAEYVINKYPQLEPKAELQDLFLQDSHFSLLKQRQTDFLSDEIYTAENYIETINFENEKLSQEVNQIHNKRFLEQSAERQHIQNLKDKEITLQEEIEETEKKIAALEKELEERN